MSDTVIQVENLAKRYILAHQVQGGARYKRFSDVLMNTAKAPFRALRKRGPTPEREEFWALRDVSFEIGRGEVVGIIGRNGAGKSTLLKILSRITEPTSGSIEIEGRVASLLEVGTGFHPELTGRENIYLNGAILGMTRREIKAKFDEIVAFAEVEKFLDTPVRFYSSGMYVRLAFAVAAHLEPEILIVDEVLAVGDAQFQKKCMGKMSDVASQGRTVLFVSHQINAIEKLCSRVILLEKGRLKIDSTDVRSVAKDYLFGSEEKDPNASTRWDNTEGRYKNPFFSPSSFYLGNSRGEPIQMPISNDEVIWVFVEGDIEQLDPALTIGYAIYAESGEMLYWSYQSDNDLESWPLLSTGKVTLCSPLPSRFFNEGSYRLELIGGLHHRQWLFEPGHDVPQLKMRIQGGLSDSSMWLQRRPGLLAPVLTWSIKS